MRQNDKLSKEVNDNSYFQNRMKKAFLSLAITAMFATLAGTARAQIVNQLRIPFTDTGAGTTAASDTSLGGVAVSLSLVSSNGVPTDYHGVPGSGVSGLNVALDFSTNSDFLLGAGEGSVAGLGPMAGVTNAALNFGSVTAFTATMWFKPEVVLAGGVTTGPRLFTLGANGVADKGVANSIGLYYQQSNEVEATINATALPPTAGVAGPIVPANQWQFYAITYDGTTATVYQGTDGSATTVASSTALAGQTVTLNNAGGSVLFIGNRPAAARPFDGWINDFRFYTGAASANAVEDIRWAAVAPTNVVGSIVANQATLTWSALGGAATYNVSNSTSASGPFTQVGSAVSGTTFTDTTTTLAPGTTYYYVVSAVNANGDATTSASSLPVTVPGAPMAVIGDLEDGGVGLTWNDSDVTGYDVLRATSAGGPWMTIATNITTTNYLDTNVTVGQQFYYYEVVGINANGPTTVSAPETVSYGQGNQLADPGFESSAALGPWTAIADQNNNPVNVTPGPTYYNSATGVCPQDPTAEPVVTHSGNNLAKIYGNFTAPVNVCTVSQEVLATPNGTWSAGGWTYASHQDLMAGDNYFYYEVDYLDINGNLLGAYESYIVSNLTCHETSPFPVDTWVWMPVTNQMVVTGGTNTGAVSGSVSVLTAPVGSAQARFQTVYVSVNYAGGSMYFDDLELDLINGVLPPSLSPSGLNGLTLCTNTALTEVAAATGGTITNVVAIIKETAFPSGIVTNMTNNLNATTAGIDTSTANISIPLTTNVTYSIKVTASDSSGNLVSSTSAFDTISPALVIEATDFNFTSGGFIDTPPNGGVFLYTNQVGQEGVDEHKVAGNTSTITHYRGASEETIIQPAGSTTFTEQKFVGVTELCVDYTSTHDWYDYTRTYGVGGSAPAGTYEVYLCLGTSSSASQAALYTIAGDPNSSDQTTNFVGYYGTASFAENAWAGYEYVPVTDQYGNLQPITIGSGPQTLRISQITNPNLLYLMLMPATPVLTPVLQYYYPDGIHPFESTNKLTFTVGPANGSNILSSGISLTVDGENVTGTTGYTVTPSGSSWIVSYPLKLNEPYTASISITNTAGLASTFPVNFDTFNVTNYQWEAVDYDFSTNNGTATPPEQGLETSAGWVSGLYIDNPVPTCDGPQTGELATNSYFAYPTGFSPGKDFLTGLGAAAQQGVDINFGNSGQAAPGSEVYRNDGVGSQAATDYVRPKFVAAQAEFNDPKIEPINIGYYAAGYWLNYTRDYPTNNYYIWGRLAGGSAYSGTTFDLVTSGVGTTNQALDQLGSFADPNASGYQTWHWIQLLDTNGNPVVASLGGKATFRVTSGGGMNTEFFMLVVAPPQFKLTPTLVGNQLGISFPTEIGHNYTLMTSATLPAPNATASWTQVGSVIPGTGTSQSVNVTITPSSAQGYYVVSVQ
jgi:hypothetical protein